MRRKGLLIVFEGIPGAGLSTQAKLLVNHIELNCEEIDYHRTSEPWKYGDTSKEINEMLYGEEEGKNYSREDINNLFLKNRREHTAEGINPTLNTGGIVITERYKFSQFMYQLRETSDVEAYKNLKDMHNDVSIPIPNLTCFLEIDEATYLKRKKNRPKLNRFEKTPYFMHRLLNEYPNLLKIVQDPVEEEYFFGPIEVFTSLRNPQKVHRKIVKEFTPIYNKWIEDNNNNQNL